LRAFDPYGQGADIALNGPMFVSNQIQRLDMTEAPVSDDKRRLHPYGIATLGIGKGHEDRSVLCRTLTKETTT